MGTVSIYPTSNAYVVSFSARKVYIPCGATLKFVDSLPNEEKNVTLSNTHLQLCCPLKQLYQRMFKWAATAQFCVQVLAVDPRVFMFTMLPFGFPVSSKACELTQLCISLLLYQSDILSREDFSPTPPAGQPLVWEIWNYSRTDTRKISNAVMLHEFCKRNHNKKAHRVVSTWMILFTIFSCAAALSHYSTLLSC